MKRIILVLVGALSVPVGAEAQTIESILAAAPARGRDAASVIKWNASHTYETLKEGTGPLVCYDRSDERDRQPYAVQCTSMANLDRVAQSRRFRAESADGAGERALVDAAEKAGTRVLPEFGSVWISRNGADQASARTHTTIAVPGATTATIGLPENGRAGGAWIMNAGTSTAHIMTPGG